MKYLVDHDLHIHSMLSSCSKDPEQTKEYILEYAIKNKLKTICLTDHFWDETVEGASNWYKKQNYEHIKKALPLPISDQVKFMFGCETDLNKELTLGISEKLINALDFIIIPTTHLHMDGFTIAENDIPSLERRKELWISRFDYILNQNLPFNKIGIAHITCHLLAPKNPGDDLKVLSSIPQKTLENLFEKSASKKIGIELNFRLKDYSSEGIEILKRIYLTAKNTGNKFYFGSDAHHPNDFENIMENNEAIVELLKLEESDKFIIR